MNAGTIIVGLIVLAIVVAVVAFHIHNRKTGRCSCGCGSCAMNGICRHKHEEE